MVPACSWPASRVADASLPYESGLIALAAAAVGIVLASAGITVLRNVGATYFPRTQEISLDGPVLALLAGLAAVSALLFGLIPALYGSGASVDESLRAMGRSSTGSRSVRHLRQVIVGSQFAIATTPSHRRGTTFEQLE